MNNFDVIIVGAGAAGLLAAGRAAELGAKVLVLEKMRQEGRKLMITGKGRCNITNNAPLEDFIKHIHPNGRFLRYAFSNYFSSDIIELLQNYGLQINLERGGRYFPASNKAIDVVHTLLKWVKDKGVEIRCGHRVENLIVSNNSIKGVVVKGENFYTEKLILATGGKSYPATGSNGEGLELARKAGHKIIKLRPSLVPLETKEDFPAKLQGLTLKNVKAVVWVNGKKADEGFGEVTFMEFGLSGPIILTLSRLIVDELHKNSSIEISIDLKPALDEAKLDRRLQRDLDENGKKRLINIFQLWLPSKMIPVFIEMLNIDTSKECHQVSGKERTQIRNLMKNMRLNISRHRSFKEAIITAGGISTSEISSKTMESKLISGLHFAGEIIDLDAETGGYNLQIAFSTGWVAGESCAAAFI